MLTRLIGVFMGALVSAGPVLAQEAYEAPSLRTSEASTTMAWVIGAVFLLGSLVVAFKPAKRSNLR